MKIMKRTVGLICLSICALGLFISTACTPPPPVGNSNQTSNNQSAANASVTPAKPSNSNSSAAAKQSKGGQIEITSVPPGAGVNLVPTSEGGAGLPQSYGVTPTTITDLEPGTYTLTLQKGGYKYFQKEIKVTDNKAVKISASLQKEAASKRK